ncbi:MAG: hypothetical protein OES64_06970, partial [Desulfobacteraceae bacterium]|nr:hypothetical protein [Desulfobacteraceae bacterium]
IPRTNKIEKRKEKIEKRKEKIEKRKEERGKSIRKPPRPPRLSESDGGQGMNTNILKNKKARR